METPFIICSLHFLHFVIYGNTFYHMQPPLLALCSIWQHILSYAVSTVFTCWYITTLFIIFELCGIWQHLLSYAVSTGCTWWYITTHFIICSLHSLYLVIYPKILYHNAITISCTWWYITVHFIIWRLHLHLMLIHNIFYHMQSSYLALCVM